jgi:hypothetical protein
MLKFEAQASIYQNIQSYCSFLHRPPWPQPITVGSTSYKTSISLKQLLFSLLVSA